MMKKDVGVVLKTSRSGETSKLVIFLGRESGKIRLIAKGAMGSKSAFRGAVEPGNIVEVVYYFKEGRASFFLREVHVHASLRPDRESLARIAASLAVLELLEQVCYWGSADAAVVDLTFEFFGVRPADPLLAFLAFELKLAEVLGVLPDFAECASCGKNPRGGFYHPSEGISVCAQHSESSSRRVRLTAELIELIEIVHGESMSQAGDRTVAAHTRKGLGKVMHWTYTFHVNGYGLPEALKLIPSQESS